MCSRLEFREWLFCFTVIRFIVCKYSTPETLGLTLGSVTIFTKKMEKFSVWREEKFWGIFQQTAEAEILAQFQIALSAAPEAAVWKIKLIECCPCYNPLSESLHFPESKSEMNLDCLKHFFYEH